MPYFCKCPRCGAHLDPGERCGCMKRRAAITDRLKRYIRPDPKTGQFALCLDEEDDRGAKDQEEKCPAPGRRG